MCLLSCLDWEKIHQQQPEREREGEETVVSLHLFLCHDTNAFACAVVHSAAHVNTCTPPTVNKAAQSGHNHSKAHKRLPSVSLTLPVGVNEPHWKQFILHCPNTITFNITVLKNERIKYLWKGTGYSLFLSLTVITLSFPLCLAPSLLLFL